MSSLYEIRQEILELTDTETGEILDVARFDELQLEEEEKIEQIGLWIKNLTAEAEAYKAEKNSFAEKEKRAKAKAESLKKYLADSLAGKPFNTTRVSIGWRKSTALEYDGVSDVPEAFLVPQDPTIDKRGITEAIKAGERLEGFELVTKQNIQVK